MARSPRRVLMLAFQFPPYDQSTGSQRILSFLRHLPALGWLPLVITARESAYPQIDSAALKSIPPGATVLRAFGFDIARTLSIKGIYPRVLATPDRWNSWIFGSVVAGMKAVRSYKPSVLWATFPTPSAIAAALLLRRLTGLPLIGDLRDPMVYETWPENSWERRIYGFLERALAVAASAVVLTTPSACRLYRERYPEQALKFHTIPNGMEPPDELPLSSSVASRSVMTLVHSGLMEVPDRDPTAFFSAIRMLADNGELSATTFRVILRASARESVYSAAVRAQGIAELVEIVPRVSRTEALREMNDASALLLFQGRQCNRQIPAKAYEYLFLGKPILCLAHAAGDTYSLLHDEWGVPYCADMDDAQDIGRALREFLADHRRGRPYVPPAALRDRHTRQAQSVTLAELLDKVAQGRP
jgi:glycosyltransferase involved in cell wall biosynthesis